MTVSNVEAAVPVATTHQTAAPGIPVVVWGCQARVVTRASWHPSGAIHAMRPTLSLLRGLGRELWHGVDAQTYVNRLRDEWDR